MRRAFQLAALGTGEVSPNPMVGCVVVYDGKIIGEGYHKEYGTAHAEPNAINNVADKGLLKKSTLYVSLEPCSHWGKTPPCADLIISHHIPKVVIANTDPNPLVAGKGMEKLKNAGIEVISGVLEAEGNELNKRFFTFHKQKRPYIILKWAQTADGFVARENFDSKWISNDYSRQLVHKWRTEEDAILVGFNTALHDNPQLNVRQWHGRNPVRIVLDPHLQLPHTHHLFDGSQKTIVFHSTKTGKNVTGVEQIEIDDCKSPKSILKALYEQKILSVIIEGGAATLQRFIDAKLWDEARIFISPNTFGKGISAPSVSGNLYHEEYMLGDVLKVMRH